MKHTPTDTEPAPEAATDEDPAVREQLDRIFAAALASPGRRAGTCPFCGQAPAYRHPYNVYDCPACDTTWITDGDIAGAARRLEAAGADARACYRCGGPMYKAANAAAPGSIFGSMEFYACRDCGAIGVEQKTGGAEDRPDNL